MSFIEDVKDFIFNFRRPVDLSGPPVQELIQELRVILDAQRQVLISNHADGMKRRQQMESDFYRWRRQHKLRLVAFDNRFKHSEILTWFDNQGKLSYYLPPEFRI